MGFGDDGSGIRDNGAAPALTPEYTPLRVVAEVLRLNAWGLGIRDNVLGVRECEA